MLVGRRATAKQAQNFRAGVPQFVPQAGRNGDGVPRPDFAQLARDADFSRAVRDEINFFRARMKMFLRARADGQPRLGEALVADGGIAVREEFADFRAVLGDESGDFVEVLDVHGLFFYHETH